MILLCIFAQHLCYVTYFVIFGTNSCCLCYFVVSVVVYGEMNITNNHINIIMHLFAVAPVKRV